MSLGIIKKFIVSLVVLFYCCCQATTTTPESQFLSLYCSNGVIPETDFPWKGCLVLDSCNKSYNRMVVCNTFGTKYVLESGMQDSFFGAAKDGNKTLNDCRNGCVYRDYNRDGIITMLGILLLYISENSGYINFINLENLREQEKELNERYDNCYSKIGKFKIKQSLVHTQSLLDNLKSKVLGELVKKERELNAIYDSCYSKTGKFKLKQELVYIQNLVNDIQRSDIRREHIQLSHAQEDLQDMHNFQAAMMAVSLKDGADLANNLNAYVRAAKKFVNRLIV